MSKEKQHTAEEKLKILMTLTAMQSCQYCSFFILQMTK